MTEHPLEAEARHRIRERLARASEPRLPTHPRRRHRLAATLRTLADRIDG